MKNEAAFLREHYATRGATFCAEALGLTWRQVLRRAHALDLRQKRRWTEHADARLAFDWGVIPLREIAKRLGRTEAALYERARQLRLGLGCPQGHAYLTHIAVECGYSTRAMRYILRWAGVQLKRGMTRPGASKRGKGLHEYVTWVVERDRAREAVEAWLAAEYVSAAADRLGLDADTLTRLLVADGRAAKPDHKHRWRVPVELCDEVVAAYRSGETMAQAARRLGVRQTRLRARMIAAGTWTPGSTRKATRFPVEVIDRVWRAAA